MRAKSLVFLMLGLTLMSCGTGGNETVEKNIRELQDVEYDQMDLAFRRLPPGVDLSTYSYSHFHISGTEEDEFRMRVNLLSMIERGEEKYISIGCDSFSQCLPIIINVFEEAADDGIDRSGLVVMLPQQLFDELEKQARDIGATRKLIK